MIIIYLETFMLVLILSHQPLMTLQTYLLKDYIMELFTAIKERRAIKNFDHQAKIPEADFTKIMESVLLSPTSYNIQHWRFVRVKEPQLRQKMKDVAWGQQQIEDASELIILCADTQAWSDRPERYWANADQSTQNMLVSMLQDFYRDKPQMQRDECMRSCGMAAQTLMLSAKALGYDTCPMVGFDHSTIAEMINLPKDHLVGMIIVMGKAAQTAHGRGGQLPLSEVLVNNTF